MSFGLLLAKRNANPAVPRRRRPDLVELKILLVTLCNERERTDPGSFIFYRLDKGPVNPDDRLVTFDTVPSWT